jgi:hypothetical protein
MACSRENFTFTFTFLFEIFKETREDLDVNDRKIVHHLVVASVLHK